MVNASLEWEKSHPHELSAAMAAPQLGINKRLIIIRDSMDDKANTSFTTLVDPEIIKQEGKIIEDFEGCLSVPFIYGKVPRYSKSVLRPPMNSLALLLTKLTTSTAFFSLIVSKIEPMPSLSSIKMATYNQSTTKLVSRITNNFSQTKTSLFLLNT